MSIHTFAICAYKESQYLEECIKSLEKQTVKTNIIICTSTPNDFIKSIAKEHNLKLFINKGESGIGPDWNFAVSSADTMLVTVAHQDDVYNENYAEEVIAAYENDKKCSIIFGDYREIKNSKIIPLTKNLKIKKFLLKKLINNGYSRRAKRRALKFGSSICCPCVTVNKEVVGETPYRTELKCDLDWDTWYYLSELDNPFIYINKELMCHRIHEESETSNLIQNNIRLEEDYKMFCKFWSKPIAKILMHYYKGAIKTNS